MKVSSFFGLSVLSLALVFTGCKKDETDNLSRVKDYPSIVLTGGPAISVPLNSTFSDPGTVTTLGAANLTPKVTGTVNTAVPGVYTISYEAANSEGDTIAVNRLVAVVDPRVTVDQSGIFDRTGFATNPPATWTRVGNGLYVTANLGGAAPGADYPAYFAQVTPTQVVFPTQNVPGVGSFSFGTPTTTFDASGKLTSYSYVVVNPGFGTARRTFTRR